MWRAIEKIGNLNLMLSVESERENGNLVTHERLWSVNKLVNVLSLIFELLNIKNM